MREGWRQGRRDGGSKRERGVSERSRKEGKALVTVTKHNTRTLHTARVFRVINHTFPHTLSTNTL